MPNTPVTLRRWQIVSSFALVFVISVLLVLINDRRTDKAIKRSNVAVLTSARALARAEVNSEVNRQQNAVRRELVHIFCSEIEGIKERIRATVRVDTREHFAMNLRRISPDISDAQIDALYNQALDQEREVHERFAARDCDSVPGG